MMHLSGFDRFAWAAGTAGEVLVVGVLFLRRRATSYPIFTAYMAIQIAKTFALYPIFYHCTYPTYERWYWVLSLFDETVQPLLIYEIAVHVFRPAGVWAQDVHRTFITLGGASIVGALLLSWMAQPIASRPIETFVLRTDLFSAVLMSELFVGMVVLSSTVGLPWKTHIARIAQGMGSLSLLGVILSVVANFVGFAHGRHIYTELTRIRIGTYLACEAYWIVMLWRDAPAPRELPGRLRDHIYSLQREVENDLIRIRSWRSN